MADVKSTGLKGEIQAQPVIEKLTQIRCSSCGDDLDLDGQPIPTQFINGIEVRSRIYCRVCQQIGAMKEGWMPQSGGRISKIFLIK